MDETEFLAQLTVIAGSWEIRQGDAGFSELGICELDDIGGIDVS